MKGFPFKNNGGEAVRMIAAELLTKSLHSPFEVQKIYTARGEAPEFTDGVDGVQKCPSVLFILSGYTDYVFILYIVKSCHEHSYGYDNSMSGLVFGTF